MAANESVGRGRRGRCRLCRLLWGEHFRAGRRIHCLLSWSMSEVVPKRPGAASPGPVSRLPLSSCVLPVVLHALLRCHRFRGRWAVGVQHGAIQKMAKIVRSGLTWVIGAGATSWVRITCMNSAGFVFHFMAS